MQRKVASQRTLDSLMAEEASESSDSSSYNSSMEELDATDSLPRDRRGRDSFYDSPVGSPSSPLLAIQCLKVDSAEPARRSESCEPPPRGLCDSEAHNLLPTPEHTAARRNVCFGANVTFEAGLAPAKVREIKRTRARAAEPESLSRVEPLGGSSRVKSLRGYAISSNKAHPHTTLIPY